jgi:hypothetical protein
MTPGREYGIGKYGRNTYDRYRAINWLPEVGVPPTDIWVPDTAPVVTDPWVSDTAVSTEIWVPIPTPVQPPWTPT